MPLVDIKSATITEKGQIAIPRSLRRVKGFNAGSKVAVLTFDDRVELRPMKQVNERMSAAFASERVLSRDWNSREDDEAWKDL